MQRRTPKGWHRRPTKLRHVCDSGCLLEARTAHVRTEAARARIAPR